MASDPPPKAPGSDPPPASEGPPPTSRASTKLLYRLAELQLRRPWLTLALAAVLVAVSLSLALRLRVQPGFEALLPANRDSVKELERVKRLTTGVSTVFVVLEGDDTDAMRKAADDIVVEVKKLGHPWVGSAESGVHDAIEYLQPRAGLFADLATLQKLHDDVLARYEYEAARANDIDIDDDEGDKTPAADKPDPPNAPPKITADDLKRRFGIKSADEERYPGGYYQSKDGKALAVTIRSAVLGTDYEAGNTTLSKVRAAVERVDPKKYHASIRWGLAGDLVSSINEYKAVNDDLTDVGMFGAALIVGVVLLYYLRFRTLMAMLVTILIGVSMTFGATELFIGQLNMATGFLFTIVAGNGINAGIIYMARYLEMRRLGHSNSTAIREAHRDTWLPTLTAACAASASYVSLLATEFRGFRDFGIIGGVGMVLCWLATYAFMPAILVVADRVSSFDQERSGFFGLLPNWTAGGTRFGAPFAALVGRAPRVAAAIGTLLTIGGLAGSAWWVARDPLEYDLEHLKSDMSMRKDEVRLSNLAVEITGHVGADGMAIVVERQEQVPLLVKELEARRDRAPADAKPFQALFTLQDFVPKDQEAKIPLLVEIKDRVLRAKKLKAIKPDDFVKLKKYLPPDGLKPFALADLPEGVARPFTERDGTRGRVVYIQPTTRDAVDDAHYLFRWADSYRSTELHEPDGRSSRVLGSGRAVIYADIWAAVISDVPKAVSLSLLLTLVVVALCFRQKRAAAIVMASLLVGIAWMSGGLALSGVRLNFLNFIALPITFGIGVDYAVNIIQRYLKEGPGGMLTAVRETGGAVVLCSMTTTLGYLALVRSVNYAVRSMGVAAVLGEAACLLAAMVLLPSLLVLRDQRRAKIDDEHTQDSAVEDAA